jgi:hypothetical protein
MSNSEDISIIETSSSPFSSPPDTPDQSDIFTLPCPNETHSPKEEEDLTCTSIITTLSRDLMLHPTMKSPLINDLPPRYVTLAKLLADQQSTLHIERTISKSLPIKAIAFFQHLIQSLYVTNATHDQPLDTFLTDIMDITPTNLNLFHNLAPRLDLPFARLT